jgi:predicted permease
MLNRMEDLEAELSFHLRETTDALVRAGWSETDARAEAERRFGSPRYRRDLARIDRAITRRKSVRALFSFDFRDAVRSLRQAPVLTCAALLSLALGIGANTALFSIVNGLILRPLPVREPSRLVLVGGDSWTNPIWEQVRARQAEAFDGALAWANETFNLAPSGQTDPIDGAYVSGSFFDMLGVGTAIGRPLTMADDTRGGGPDGAVAVIGYGFWQRRFGGTPEVIGRRLSVNQTPITIVGVAPRGFLGTEIGRTAELFLPLADEGLVNRNRSSLDARSSWWLNVMLRLKPGQTIDAATATLNQWRPAVREATMPSTYGPDGVASYLSDSFTLVQAATGRSTLRTRFSQPLTVIMIVVAGVLLIACANIANLMLARATARRHEMSVKLALGASRARLIRQLLVEGLILAVLGSVAGLAIARWGGALLIAQLRSAVFAPSIDLSIDWRVLAFTAGVGLVTTLFFGLAPAAGLEGLAPNDALKEQGRSVAGDRRLSARNLLVVVQIALSLVLVVGAGLFVRTFYSLATTPLGFSADRLLIVNIDSQRSVVAPADRLALFNRAMDAVAAVPGVASVSQSYLTPLSGRGWNNRVKMPASSALAPRERMTFQNGVSPGWLDTYGMRLVAGRDVSGADVKGAEPAVVVNEAFMRKFIGAEPPIGHIVELDGPGGATERFVVVGVVKDSIYRSARAGIVPTMFLPIAQVDVSPGFSLTIKQAADGAVSLDAVRDALIRVDPAMTFSFRDYSDQLRATMSQERLVAMLSGFFGALALILAALGLYGVTSYSVTRRASEIAIRMALGADAGGVVQFVLRRVSLLVLAGTVAGAGLALWVVKFIGALLFRLEARDPVTLIVAIAILAIVAFIAGWLPARRAARLDPTVVLRQ